MAHQPSDYQLVTGFRKAMDGIGREAMAFVDQYKRMAEEPALRASFAQRIRQIEHDRMSRKEATLYQPYQPSY